MKMYNVYILEDPLMQFDSKYSGLLYYSSMAIDEIDTNLSHITYHYKQKSDIEFDMYYKSFKLCNSLDEFMREYNNFNIDKIDTLSKIVYLLFKKVRVDKSQYHLHKYLYALITNIALNNNYLDFNTEDIVVECWDYGTVFPKIRKNFSNLNVEKQSSNIISGQETYFAYMLSSLYFPNTNLFEDIMELWDKYNNYSFDELLKLNHDISHLWHKKYIANKNSRIKLEDIIEYEQRF